ncbi:hypothetical protein pb186bvf_004226 [Paramecium bursaria]
MQAQRFLTPDYKGQRTARSPGIYQNLQPATQDNQFTSSQIRIVNEIVRQQPEQYQHVIGQQLLQLNPNEISDIQRKLQQGEVLTGLSQLPAGAQPTHKFVVKIRKPVVQEIQKQTQQVIYCQNCNIYIEQIRQLQLRIEQLVQELDRSTITLNMKNNEVIYWKEQYDLLRRQQMMGKPQDSLRISDYQQQLLQDQNNQLKQSLAQSNRQIEQLKKQIDAPQIYRKPNQEAVIQMQDIGVIDLQEPEVGLQSGAPEFQSGPGEFQSAPDSGPDESLPPVKKPDCNPYSFYKPPKMKDIPLQIQNEMQSMENEIQDLQQNMDDLQQRNEQFQNELENKDRDLQALEDERDQLNSRYQIMVNKVRAYEDQLTERDQRINNLQQQLRSQDRGKTVVYNDNELELLRDQLRTKQKEIEVLNTKLYVIESSSKNDDELRSLRRQYDDLKRQYELECEQTLQLRRKLEELKREFNQYEINISQRGDTRIRDLELQILQREERIKQLNNELSTQRQQYEYQITNYQTQIKSVRIESSNTRELGDLRDQLDLWKSKYSQLEMKINRENDTRYALLQKDFESQLLLRTQEIETLKFRALKDLVVSLRREIEIKDQSLRDLQSRYQQLQTQLYQLENKLREKDQIILDLQSQKESIESRFYSLQQSYETVQITLNEYQDQSNSEILKQEIRRLQKTIVELRSEIDKLLIQAKDNQWLQKRYEEQQLIIEQFKVQLENRESVSKEYTYQVATNNSRPSTTREIHKEQLSFGNLPNNQKISESNTQYLQLPDVVTSTFKTRQVDSINYNSKQQPYMDRLHIEQVDDLRRSRAEVESRAQRWDDDYNQTVDQIITRKY